MGASTASSRVSARRAACVGDVLGVVLEQLPAGVAAAGVAAGLHAAVPARHDLRAQADARPVVGRGAAVRAEHLDPAVRLGVPDARLSDLGAGGAGALVAGAEQVGLAARLHVLGGNGDAVAPCRASRP